MAVPGMPRGAIGIPRRNKRSTFEPNTHMKMVSPGRRLFRERRAEGAHGESNAETVPSVSMKAHVLFSRRRSRIIDGGSDPIGNASGILRFPAWNR